MSPYSFQAVRSERGFEVESMGRFTIDYREGSKKLSIYVENGMEGGKPCVIIMKPTAFERWDGDSPGAINPLEKQQEMIKNFIEAMEFQGLAVIINGFRARGKFNGDGGTRRGNTTGTQLVFLPVVGW